MGKFMVRYTLTGVIEVEAENDIEAGLKLHDSIAFDTKTLVERVNEFVNNVGNDAIKIDKVFTYDE